MSVITYELQSNFEAALVAWLAGNATLVSLTGYNASTKPEGIYVARGDESLQNPPHLIVDDCAISNYMNDVDSVKEAFIHLSAYALDRISAVNIAGAVGALASQDASQQSASFASGHIRTLFIAVQDIGAVSGKTKFGVTAAHRTQVPAADVHIADISLRIVFVET